MRRTQKTLNVLIYCSFLLVLQGYNSTAQVRVGILIGSYGDVDAPNEVEPFVKKTLMDPDVIPLNHAFRTLIAEVGYRLRRSSIHNEYRMIGGKTNFRENTANQVEGVAAELRKLGWDARGYVGLTMTFPFVAEALDQARLDGVTHLVVIYQGAQYSRPTTRVLFRHVEEYLKNHPEWHLEAFGVKSFHADERFLTLLSKNIESIWKRDYPNIDDDDLCLFLPIHGNLEAWERQGDPYRLQVLTAINYLRERFPKTYITYGFQNHDEIPIMRWTKPDWKDALDELATKNCSVVIASGQISYTVDSLETLFDHLVEAPDRLQKRSRHNDIHKQFTAIPMFNADHDFIMFLRDLTLDALKGKGDVIHLDHAQAATDNRPPSAEQT